MQLEFDDVFFNSFLSFVMFMYNVYGLFINHNPLSINHTYQLMSQSPLRISNAAKRGGFTLYIDEKHQNIIRKEVTKEKW